MTTFAGFLRRSLLAVAALAAAGVALAQSPSALLPFAAEDTKARIDKEYFAAGKQHKALALTEAGAYHFVQGRATLDEAIALALTQCQDRNTRNPCFIAAEDNQLVVQSRYTPDEIQRGALELLRRTPLAMEAYFEEDRDAGVPPTKAFRTREAHAPTPTTVPGAKTISTRALAEMLKNSKPVLINVLDWKEGAFAIPGTLWIQGVGKPLGPRESGEFKTLLAQVAPDRNTPIVVYCLSWECWMSYNAALTLRQFDYTNVYWYRGGLFSWNQAGLPVVRAKLHKQL